MSSNAINLKLANGLVSVFPAAYLGTSFDTYRSACMAGGAKFDRVQRCNVVALENVVDLVFALEKAGFTVAMTDEVRATLQESLATEIVKDAEVVASEEAMSAALAARGLAPFAFQKAGVAWLRANARCFLTDQMGLGKTPQAALALAANTRAIVVCPASLKRNWRRELATWRPELVVTMLEGRGSLNRWPNPGEVLIVNYDILSDEIPGEAPAGMQVIIDEVHNLKNYKSLRAKRGKYLSSKAATVWGLTGTPIQNNPMELWSLCSLVGCERKAFGGGWNGFLRVFSAYKTAYGYEFGKPTVQAETCIRKVAFGRRREDVLPDLPGKLHQTLECEIDPATAKLCDELLKILEARGVDLESLLETVARDIQDDRHVSDAADDGDFDEDYAY